MDAPRSAIRHRRAPLAVLMTIALATALAAPAIAVSPNAGFWTARAPMLRVTVDNGFVRPLLSVGDTVAGYRFESLPDGIAVDPNGQNDLDIYVNHETSLVPFPVTPAPFSDFDNSQLSRITLKRGAGKILRGSLVIPSLSNYQRFCSNSFAGAAQGFDRPLVLTGEEASDFVNRTGIAWPAATSEPPSEQAGVAVAYDPASGDYRTIYGMGRMNHENEVPVPGFGKAVIVTGDDTFAAPSSQLFMYVAEPWHGSVADAVWNDTGHLYAFQADDAAVNDYGDIHSGDSLTGDFIPVPDGIADGPQGPLESWSNTNNVFQFIRVEDLAYDVNTPNVVYFADTGEPRAIPDTTTGRLRRGSSSTRGAYPNGRIFRMALDPADPTHVLSLSILIDGDALGTSGYNVGGIIHNPDNLESTARSLLIQEDPGSHNQTSASFPGAPSARIWRYDLATGALSVVAEVDQSQDPAAPNGAWESTGLVDVSAYFGAGAFLVNVQAHTRNVESVVIGGTTYKREDGQLLLIRIPGS